MSSVEIPTIVFKQLVDKMSLCTEKAVNQYETSRPILQYIKLTVNKDNIVAISCNGHMASRITVNNENDLYTYNNEPFTVLIKSMPIPYIDNELLHTTISLEEGRAIVAMQVLSGRIIYEYTQIETPYPNIDKIIDSTTYDSNVSVNPLALANLIGISKGKVLGGVTDIKINSTSSMSPIGLFTEGDLVPYSFKCAGNSNIKNNTIKIEQILLPVRYKK